MSHIAGKDDGWDGADEAKPAAKKDDNKCGNDGKHHALVPRSMIAMYSYHCWLGLMLYHNHIR